ncbi:MAG: hypothetical protein K6T55_03800 [Syntrophobacterales bacterium]|nr:hypothetical protein [Syntrophobacterales bacterium]
MTTMTGLWGPILCATVVLCSAPAFAAGPYETPTDKRASEVLPAELRSGPHFTVQEQVQADGCMLRFTVTSDYGTFAVTGESGLRKLIREIQAIAALKEMSKGEAFAKGVGGKAQETLEFGANLVTEPGRTLASVPQGVAKLFDNLATGMQKPAEPRRDRVGEQLLNVSEAKRKLAYELGVDVYSSNRVLKRELESLSKAQALGSLGVSAAIPYGGGTVVSLSRMSQTAGEIHRLLRDESPSGLRNLNERKLQAMGVDRGIAERFLSHTPLSPRHQTIMVASLEKLAGARGREAVVQFACQAHDEDSATFMQNLTEILAAYHQTVSPLREVTAPGIILARAANGTILIPFPLDYGVWTPRADRVVTGTLAGYRTPDGQPARYEFWVTGAVSPLARRQLEARGITVKEGMGRRLALMI